MAGKGGRQRERERHTGEPSTQARSTWPTHIAPTRFLSLADNCTISLHSLVSSPLSSSAHCAYVLFFMSFPRRSAISLSQLPSSSDALILPPRHLSHFHAASRCHPISCTLFPLVYTRYPVASFVRALSFSSVFFSHAIPRTCARNLRKFSLCHTLVCLVYSRALLRLSCSWLLPP